ncbi:MAG TPA: hypothetical protein VK508_20480 [Cyclobacteriaceae bacterium]|nr:hypothetical protein [Cyclobacteriaceae bacterium]
MKRLIHVSILASFCVTAFAQDQPKPEPKKEITELRLNLNEEGSHYIKGTFSNQVWFRFNQSNPGTTSLGDPKDQTFDIGLRRTRFQLYGELTDHVGFYFQFGQNNFNWLAGQNGSNNGNRKVQVFIHDALAEYRIKKHSDILYLGGGLTITNGLSRFTQPSVSSIMSMDVPVFLQATVDQTDEFSRKLSIYARGQVGRLDYRLVMSDPFPVTSNGNAQAAIGPNSNFAYNHHNKQYQGFFVWNIFDKEPHTTPYMAGSYLGKKKVLNIEAGIISQKDAMWTGDLVTQTYHNLSLWSVALFYDAPVNSEKGTAFNAYGGYFHTDYGPGYLRYNGQMNPTNGTTIAGAPGGSFGNAYPMFGTGNVIYAQAGYLMRRDLLGENGTLMPYATIQSANYDRLNKQMTVYAVGMNWLIKGNNSKITLDYQVRPTYSPVGTELIKDSGMRSQVVVQYQILF